MVSFIDCLESYVPKNAYSQFVWHYFGPIWKNGTQTYIRNLQVSVKLLSVRDLLVPVSYDNAWKNCYVSSLLGMLSYLQWESRSLGKCMGYFVTIFAFLARWYAHRYRLYENIYVNNLLLSTNLYPDFSREDITAICDFLRVESPESAIIFRNVNTRTDTIDRVFPSCVRVATRQVFIFEQGHLTDYLGRSQVREDAKACDRLGYTVIAKDAYSDQEIAEMAACYDHLYREKYTSENPDFTLEFLRHVSTCPHFFLRGLEKDGRIEGVFGYFVIYGQATTPVFGYTNDDRRAAIYRQISYHVLREVLALPAVLNHSSWAGTFKTYRWAKMYLEYLLVYCDHLPFRKRIFWKTFAFLSRHVGEKLLTRTVY